MAPGTPRPGEAILGAYRQAVDLLQETLRKVQAAWNQLIDAVQALLQRAQHFLNTDSIWSTIVQKFTQDVVDAIEAINSMISRIRPEVDKLFEALRKAADNSVPVFSLFETAITFSHDIVDQVSGISADMTGHGDIDLCRRAFQQGAIEFLTKPVDEQDLLDAVQRGIGEHRQRRERRAATVRARERLARLSGRETEVLRLMVDGHGNKQAARLLGISARTVETHRASIFEKLEVDSLAQLVRVYLGSLETP